MHSQSRLTSADVVHDYAVRPEHQRLLTDTGRLCWVSIALDGGARTSRHSVEDLEGLAVKVPVIAAQILSS